MDFGQTIDPITLSDLKMTLPTLDSPEENVQLERLARAATRSKVEPQIFVGAPIWSYTPWVGNLYPEGTESAQFLREYSRQFNTVEVNSTFYAIPSSETFLKWRDSVGEGFRFCPKFPKSISHSLDGNHPDLKTFVDRIMGLEGKLGICFLQLPHYFNVKEKDRLIALLSKLPRELKAGIELRNSEFFQNQRLKSEWVETLATSFMSSVSVDTPLERQVAHVSLTSTRMMIRFLGANFHDSDSVRLKDWAKRIALWHHLGLKEIYFLIHQPDNSLAPQSADFFIKTLNEELKSRAVSYQVNPSVWNHLLA